MKTLNELAQEAITVTDDKKQQFAWLKQEVYTLTGQYLASTLLIERLNQARDLAKPKIDMAAFLS
jgi:hypothetical protein